MSLKKVLWAFASVGAFSLSLWLLRSFGILGNEVNILVRWLTIIGSILFGVFIGIAVAGKKIGVKGIVVNMLLGLTVLFLSPIIGFTIAQPLPLSIQYRIIASATISGSFGVLFIWFIYWLRKKGFLKYTEINWTEK
jgi:hypothetical protein